MTWVPAKDRTPAWLIFHRRFRVTVNEMQYRGAEHIKKFGVVMTGNEELDSTVSKRLIIVMLSAAEMATLHSSNIAVGLTNPPDAKEIYEMVQAHITAWIDHMAMAYSSNAFPLDDLLALDNFAATVYPHAVKYFNNEIVSDLRNRLFGNLNSGLASIGRLGNWSPNPEKDAAQKKAATKALGPQRVGYADQFTRAIRKRDFPRKF